MIPAACIVDASVAVKWVVSEPDSTAAAQLLGSDMAAPELMLIECAGVLWKHVRRGVLTPAEAAARLVALRGVAIDIVPSATHLDAALARAMAQAHPIYDCVYLALARHRGWPLVTADSRLVALGAPGEVIALSDIG